MWLKYEIFNLKDKISKMLKTKMNDMNLYFSNMQGIFGLLTPGFQITSQGLCSPFAFFCPFSFYGQFCLKMDIFLSST